VQKRDEKKMALLPEMTKENRSFAIACVLSDNFRFQSEYNIEPMAKPIKIALWFGIKIKLKFQGG